MPSQDPARADTEAHDATPPRGTPPLKVLMSAYACEPGKGSEPTIGWNMAKAISLHVELSVVTRANNRRSIEDSGEDWVRRVHWVYYDPPRWMTWWKTGGRGIQAFYLLWQLGVYLKLASSGSKGRYDVVHHVTLGKYWVPSVLVLLGAPTIFGPVGGGEYTPAALRGAVSEPTLRAERWKRSAAWLLTRNPISLRLYRKLALAYAATPQTRRRLLALGVRKVEVLPQSGVSTDELTSYAALRQEAGQSPRQADFVACAAARLIPWKGVDIVIRAFIAALPSLPDLSVLNVAGDGPEIGRLRKLVKEAGAEDKVMLLGRLPPLDVHRMMARSNCLLHAATSEAFGCACVEALGVGTPVVCWDYAGPGMIVNADCGVPVALAAENPIEAFAQAIKDLGAESEPERRARRARCVARVADTFSWERTGVKINRDYGVLVRDESP